MCNPLVLSSKDIEGVRESGRINTALLDFISGHIREGMTTNEIDNLILNETKRLGAHPAPLNYNGYPKSICTSINDQVCHGIPSDEDVLKNGDIINIDVSTNFNGYYSDSARVFCIGQVSAETKKLVDIAKACIEVGLEHVKPWSSMKHIGRSINQFAKKHGYSVASCIGGHGIGLSFHSDPFVSFDKRGTDVLMKPGMIFTIEPALNMGTADAFEDADNGWTIYTYDGKPSAQWEVTVLVTETGYEILAY